MSNFSYLLLLFALLFGNGWSVSAQTDSTEYDISDARVGFFTADQPFEFALLDTSLYRFHRFNPAYRGEFGYTELGNLGTATRAVVFQPKGQVGFDAGRHAFDPYLSTFDNLKYLRANKPYTELYYVLGSKLEQLFQVRHSQQPFPNLNLSLDYSRFVSEGPISHHKTGISRLGLSGWYRAPNRRYSATLGFTYNDLENEENGGIAISEDSARNVIREEIPVSLLTPETLEKGKGVQLKQSWSLGPAYTWVVNDSLRLARIQPSWSFYHDFRYSRQEYTYRDLAVDTSFYTQTLFSEDTTITNFGYRRFINRLGLQSNAYRLRGDSLIQNNFRLNVAAGFDGGYYEDSFGRAAVNIAFVEFSAALDPTDVAPLLFAVDAQAASSGEFSLDGKVGFSVRKKVRQSEETDSLPTTAITILEKGSKGVKTEVPAVETSSPIDSAGQGKASLLIDIGNKGDSTLADSTAADSTGFASAGLVTIDSGALRDSLRLDSLFGHLPKLLINAPLNRPEARKELLRLEAGIALSRLGQSRIMDRMYGNHGFWGNDFDLQSSFQPYFQFVSDDWKSKLRFQYTLVDKLLYWDEAAQPEQHSGTIGVLAFLLQQEFQFGYFHFDNEIALQWTGTDLVNLPIYRGRHNFYFQKYIFDNALFAQIGIDLTFATPYFADQYDPVTAQYFLQQTDELSFVPDVDVYFSAIVKRARFFIKGRYVTGGFQTPVNFQSPAYPSEGFGLQLGVNWKFWY